jgi:hypothetical protein
VSHIIGLGSIRPTGEEMVYLQVSELQNETLFNLDRTLRAVVKEKPFAEWDDFVPALEREGFTSIPKLNSPLPIYIHSRPWDEHMVENGESFLVAFPSDAPFELAEALMVASPSASFYAPVSADYITPSTVVLINSDHEPIYANDMVWHDAEQTEQVPLGGLHLIREQFTDDAGYDQAKRALIDSGYVVLEAEATLQ